TIHVLAASFLGKNVLVAGESGVAAALCHRSPKHAGAFAVLAYGCEPHGQPCKALGIKGG
ncbi:MAG: hypothetical protein P4N60_09240, partial [Verrucomicrobiae bacterium]|nr:hypothetical protein [Verrucomicrobiae bacterium]